jgi:hypothetical protein
VIPSSGRSGRLPALLFALLLVVPPLLLHARHLGPGQVPYLRDLSRTHFPLKYAAVQQMRDGHLPRWNPAHGAGSPLLGNANFFHLHPVTLLFLLLPYPTAFSLGLATLGVAAAVGAGLWLSGRGASDIAAATGAAAFALGGLGASTANLYNLHASYAAVPWALWASDRIGRKASPRNLAILALALAAAAAGGEPTAWAWAVLLALVAGGARRGPRAALAHAGAAVLSLGLAALQLLPLAAITGDTLRGRGFTLAEATRYSLEPARIRELILPPADPLGLGPGGDDFARLSGRLLYSIYPGIAVLALAAVGLGGPRPRQDRLVLAAIAALSLVLALGAHTPFFPLLFRLLPPLHYLRYPEKLLLPFFLALAALATAGADRLRSRATGRLAILPWVLFAAVAGDLLRAHLALVPGGPGAGFLEPPPIARALAGHRAYFWVERESYLPPGQGLLDFHLGYARRAIPPAGLAWGVSYVFDLDADRLDSLRGIRLAQLVHAPGGRPRLLPLAGVERVVSPQPIENTDLALAGSDPIFTYSLRDPVALVRLVPAARVRPARDAEEAARAIADPGFDPRHDAVFEGPAPQGAPGPVAPRWSRPDPATFEIDAAGPGLVVVTESFAPGWQATVDGRPAPLHPANLAFLGLRLEDGAHRVRIEYRPRSIRRGTALSLGSLAVTIAALFQGMRMRASQVAAPSTSAAAAE